MSRIRHSLGFGIQSPTDYDFERHVINEHAPYYAYDSLGRNDSWLHRKLGRLYFRLANWRQPETVIDKVGAMGYVKAGCRQARTALHPSTVQLALLSSVEEAARLLPLCDDRSVIVVENIRKQKKQWQQMREDSRIKISFDLYYCAVLLFDSKRTKQHYIVNF